MKRVNESNINTPQYWDGVYSAERGTGKRRIDDERINYAVGQAKDYADKHPNQKPFKILDVGCGDGEFLRFFHAYLPEWNCTGMDIVSETLTFARKDNPGMDFVEGNANDINYQDLFDVVFMGETLEHLEAPEAAIEQLFKACKKDGYVIISTPNEHSNYSPEHINEFTIGELIMMMEKQGTVKYHDVRAVCNGISQIITAIK